MLIVAENVVAESSLIVGFLEPLSISLVGTRYIPWLVFTEIDSPVASDLSLANLI